MRSAFHARKTGKFAYNDERAVVYDQREDGRVTLVRRVAEKVLLAITGIVGEEDRVPEDPEQDGRVDKEANSDVDCDDDDVEALGGQQGLVQFTASSVEDIQLLSSELATILREEMKTLRWPEDL